MPALTEAEGAAEVSVAVGEKLSSSISSMTRVLALRPRAASAAAGGS